MGRWYFPHIVTAALLSSSLPSTIQSAAEDLKALNGSICILLGSQLTLCWIRHPNPLLSCSHGDTQLRMIATAQYLATCGRNPRGHKNYWAAPLEIYTSPASLITQLWFSFLSGKQYFLQLCFSCSSTDKLGDWLKGFWKQIQDPTGPGCGETI